MKSVRGFTLIELVVATAIFFIMSAMLYGTLNSVRRQLEFSEDADASLRELHYAMRRIALDAAQIYPRPVRDELGDVRGAVSTESGEASLEISVGGWRNPIAMPRASIQRVAYIVDGDVLARLHWPVLDRTSLSEPLRIDLLSGVINVQLRFLSANGEWIESWPPQASPGNEPTRSRPKAIEILIEHEDWGILNRVVEIAG